MRLEDLPDVSALAAPLYLVLIAIEVASIQWGRARGAYDAKDTAASISMGLGNVIFDASTRFFTLGATLLAYEFRIATVESTLLTGALCFLLDDLRYYASHRASHRVRWFWASHVIHHSSEHYNLGTALRQPWLSAITGLVVFRLPLALVGFHPALIAFCGGLNLIYQFWIHTEAIDKLPRWFEAVFNTPSHHRVHHAVNPRYLDANYAGTLIVWDRIFGSFVPEHPNESIRYGIVHQLGTFNPLRIATHEYAAIARDLLRSGLELRARLGYLFGPPGWSHDGSRSQSTDLKRAFVEAHPECSGEAGLPAAQSPL